MILNAKNNQFQIFFNPLFIYKDVDDRWKPVIKRFKLPYEKTIDYLNSCIQSVSWPSITIPTVGQQQTQFPIKYKTGKELEPIMDKTITVTFKLSEGLSSYFILWDQIEEYLRYDSDKVFWEDMYINFLDLHGFSLLNYKFKQLIPTGLSQFDLSYASQAADFNTFTLTMNYNRYEINRQIE